MAGLESAFNMCSEEYSTSEDAYTRCLFNVINSQLSGPIVKLERLPQQILDEAGKVVKATGKTIEDQAVKELTSISGATREFVNNTDRTLNNNLSDIGDTIKDVNASIYDQAEKTAQRVDETFTVVDDYVRNQSVQTSQATQEVVNSAINDINRLAKDVSSDNEILTKSIALDVKNLTKEVQSGIRTDIDESVYSLQQVALSYVQANQHTIDEYTKQTGEVVESSGDLAVQSGRVADNLNTIGFKLEEQVMPGLNSIGNNIKNSWFMQNADDSRNGAEQIRQAMVNPEIVLARMVSGELTFSELFAAHGTDTTFFGAVLAAIQQAASNVLMAMHATTIANSTRVESMLNQLWKNDPVKVLSFVDAVSLTARGHISKQEGKEEAKQTGYDEKRFDTALKGIETPLSVEKALDALHRGTIDESEFSNYLKRQAYNEKDIEVLRAIGNLRPSIQDIITMALRDVFNEQAVTEFQLFEELPKRFVEEAGKSGLSEDWARFYWGAHWHLPSLSDGFKMFHRRIIEENQLELLIKLHDVSPFWRDKLIALGYQPITRVDIRRMYKLGVMDENEVYERHLDLGYSPNDAKKMTKFVVSLIDDQELEDDVDPRSLTQTQIKTLFLQGTLYKQEAIDKLIEAEYSSDAALLLVGSWETDQQIKDRDAVIKLIISKAVREQLNTSEIEQLFAGLDLTVRERENILREIALKSSEYPSTPSKTELRQMVQGGIITFDEWFNAMQRLGYNETWVNRYVQLWSIPNGA